MKARVSFLLMCNDSPKHLWPGMTLRSRLHPSLSSQLSFKSTSPSCSLRTWTVFYTAFPPSIPHPQPIASQSYASLLTMKPNEHVLVISYLTPPPSTPYFNRLPKSSGSTSAASHAVSFCLHSWPLAWTLPRAHIWPPCSQSF